MGHLMTKKAALNVIVIATAAVKTTVDVITAAVKATATVESVFVQRRSTLKFRLPLPDSLPYL